MKTKSNYKMPMFFGFYSGTGIKSSQGANYLKVDERACSKLDAIFWD
ncbi:hypothetical protein [Flagellimonas meridianipacifica]|nr:hypothetical protein [Allomuricauda pacifica]